MLGPRRGSLRHDRGRVSAMAEFWTLYLWPLIVIVAQSLLLLVLLLVSIAYVLLADRKIWAAVQIRRGPNVVGPWGLLQSFADLLQFVFKEPVIPAGSNKGAPLLEPAGMTGSLNTNFNRSAKDCSKPQGPTTLGPRRICTAAQIFRSASST